MSERQNIEWKESWYDDYLKWVCGFVNAVLGGQDGGQDGGQVKRLTARQKDVLELIVANPKISRKELSEILGINESAIQKHTDALKRKNVIEREIETTGQWIIKGKK